MVDQTPPLRGPLVTVIIFMWRLALVIVMSMPARSAPIKVILAAVLVRLGALRAHAFGQDTRGFISKRSRLWLAFGLALFLIAGQPAFAATYTTYDYSGPLYIPPVNDPNLGTHMTWSITLDCGGACANFTGALVLSPAGAISAGSNSPGVIAAGVTSFEMTSGNVSLVLDSNNLHTEITDFLAFQNGAIIGWNLGLGAFTQYDFLSNYKCSTGNVSCSWLAQDSAYDNTAGRGGNDYHSSGTSQNLPVVATTPLSSTWSMMLIGLAGLGVVGYRASKKAALLAAT
jgi:hypothetical protein